MFPERFSDLPAYAFPRLRALLDCREPGGDILHMTIGEPRHAPPDFVMRIVAQTSADFAKYPPNDGTEAFQSAISGWVLRRYGVELAAASQVLPLNGTREGLYNAAMALCPEQKNGARPVVLIPNPFYQVYMVATLSTGAEPVFVPATEATGFLPDYAALPADVLDRVALAYVCSPSNPQGAVADRDYWKALISLAEKHDFRILADECYSEIYRTAPPVGALEVAKEMGADPERMVIFHSLSKRSNLPGLRSGFAAGGPESIARMKQLRAYAGAPLPLPIQHASAAAWDDEAHVVENRALYQEKFALADQIFAGIPGYAGPEGGFFLWLPVPDGEQAAVKLWEETGIRVLPGAYLAREVDGVNPGARYLRVAMVAPAAELADGLSRLRACLYD
ncbi:Aspartate/methionine/tyrosine aminotransferase [Poseidonocella pacifica]|uniref:Aspartate/methionine/tyrosine aminotransferase n=1 Tax=Poseidonocella pacifica TaxID=871651 RepID=A0A1I0XL02_9RHOB|nr:aminotransferase class I/II-fold pyridoxal phosphate-dependent enzyme [Poseidonocella pacifica]SFB01715.1 Aspartate/methionine/tyrosine aminotransferase [Poseidonocella pacifica]